MALTRITGTVIKDGGLQSSDLPDSGVTANSYGSGTAIPVLTVNSKGIVTAVSETSVAGVSSLSWDSGTEILTLSTADGGSFTADISGMASESYVDTAISNLINSAPGTLDTLDELAAALGDDANFASTVTNSLATKVDKINITGATVGSASQVPVITFNAQGQITSATSTAVAGVSALSYNQITGVLTIDTADGGQFTTDIIVGKDDEPEFTNIFINDTGSTVRGIARTDAAYSLNIMGGADVTDGARIQFNGGQRGGNGSVNNASLEFYTGSDYAASQSAVVGDYYFKTQWLGNSKTLMQIDSSTGYVGINKVGAPAATLDVGGNIAVSGTVDGRDLTADGTKLDGIESGATADQTASEILTLIKTVDGSGSGLDADTLDGLNSSQFIRSDSASFSQAFSGNIDSQTGISFLRNYATGGGTHAFGTSHHNVFTIPNTSASSYYNAQLAFETDNSGGLKGGIKWRSIGSSSSSDWSDWFKIWHENNDGAGSGLDADTVDGLHAPQFLRSDQTDIMQSTTTAIKLHVIAAGSNQAGVDFQNGNLWSRLILDNDDLLRVYNQTSGFNAFAIKSNGNVGIGTDTPNDKLQVQGTIRAYAPTANDWTFLGYNSANTATSGLWYTNDSARFLGRNSSNQVTVDLNTDGISFLTGGNVGIGTTAPVTKFVVQDASSLMAFQDYAGSALLWLDGINGDLTGGDYAAIQHNETGLQFHTQSLNQAMVITGTGNVGIGTSSPTTKLHIEGSNQRLQIKSTSDNSIMTIGQWDTVNNRIESGSRPLFLTSYSDGIYLGPSGSKQHVFNNAGNVGIGTTSPHADLHLYSPSASTGGNQSYFGNFVMQKGYTGWNRIRFDDSNGDAEWGIASNPNSKFAISRLNPNWANTPDDDNFVIDTNGKVGIGTDSPTANLDVEGDVSASFFLSDTVINTSYTVPTGKNAMTAGPVTISDGVTITVPDGTTWTVV